MSIRPSMYFAWYHYSSSGQIASLTNRPSRVSRSRSPSLSSSPSSTNFVAAQRLAHRPTGRAPGEFAARYALDSPQGKHQTALGLALRVRAARVRPTGDSPASTRCSQVVVLRWFVSRAVDVAGRAGTGGEVAVARPVRLVVARATARLGEVRDFVVFEAGGGEAVDRQLRTFRARNSSSAARVRRASRDSRIRCRVRTSGRRWRCGPGEGDGGVEVGQPLVQCFARRGENEIERHLSPALCASDDRADDIVRRVIAFEQPQFLGAERLSAQAQPRDAQLARACRSSSRSTSAGFASTVHS